MVLQDYLVDNYGAEMSYHQDTILGLIKEFMFDI